MPNLFFKSCCNSTRVANQVVNQNQTNNNDDIGKVIYNQGNVEEVNKLHNDFHGTMNNGNDGLLLEEKGTTPSFTKVSSQKSVDTAKTELEEDDYDATQAVTDASTESTLDMMLNWLTTRCCDSSSATKQNQKIKGVSVHWLKNGFLKEVQATNGLSETSNIYEIENLSSDECGVIRSKGKDVVCPRDGRMGAAYVDCLQGKDNVGQATVMLSYGWRYSIKDIVDTLESYCKEQGLDIRRTYVWICCLCNNQFRVAESMRLGSQKSQREAFIDFQNTFQDRVVGIGHVIAMMYPWDKPVYLSRIWCIFELYCASEDENCKLSIAMPPDQKAAMIAALRQPAGVDTLYKNLSATKIENAEASQELDRVRILEMVRNGPGYHELNRKVNMLIREWVHSGLLDAVNEFKKKNKGYIKDPEYAALCNDIAKVMRDQGDLEEANKLQHDAFHVFEKCEKQGTMNDRYRRMLADSHNNYGLLLKREGKYSEAKEEFQKAMDVGKKVWTENDYDAAQTYNNIGLALDDMREFDGALEAYEQAQKLVEASLGPNHPNVAGAISNIGYLLSKMGRMDEAVEKMKQVIAIDEKSNGLDHPDTANSYNILGVMLTDKGDYEEALVQYHKCLAVREKIFGKDSTITATSYHNIGSVYYDLGRYEEAMKLLQQAFDAYAKLGEDHPECQVTKSYISLVKAELEKK